MGTWSLILKVADAQVGKFGDYKKFKETNSNTILRYFVLFLSGICFFRLNFNITL